MPENEKQPFFDRAWWQQFTSNALGSAVGTGLVAAAGLFVAVVTGIVQTPNGVAKIVTAAVGMVFALACVIAAIVAFRQRTFPVGGAKPFHYVLTMGFFVGFALLFAGLGVYSAFFLHPAACTNPSGCTDSFP